MVDHFGRSPWKIAGTFRRGFVHWLVVKTAAGMAVLYAFFEGLFPSA